MRDLSLLGETDVAGELLVQADPAVAEVPSLYILAPDLSRWQVALKPELDTRETMGEWTMHDAGALKCEAVWTTQGGRQVLSVRVPGTGTIEATVVGPDGRVLKDTAVEVYPSSRGGDSRMRLTGRTDADGRISVRLFPGLYSMYVVVRGTGFGTSGTIEVRPDEVARADLPMLVPFATVEGRVDKAAVIQGGHVRVDPSRLWNAARASVAEDGRFLIEDVTPGVRTVIYEVTGAAENVQVRVRPGEAIRGVLLKAREAAFGRFAVMRLSWSGTAIISGRVTHQGGRPAAGARVYVISAYDGGIRLCQEVVAATTNQRGEYNTPVVRVGQGRIVLVAYVEGFPPALGTIPQGSLPPAEEEVKQIKLRADLVVAARGGGLSVHVVADGKPVPNAVVVLLPEDYSRSFAVNPYVMTLTGADLGEEINRLTMPAGRTDEGGAASFTDLVPGTYAVLVAADTKEGELRQIAFTWRRLSSLVARGGDVRLTNRIGAVPVAAGETRSVSVAVYRQPTRIKPLVMHPEGFPLTDSDFAQVQVLSLLPSGYWLRTGNEPKGEAEIRFDAPGYWAIEIRYRPQELGAGRIETEPYCRGRAYLAVSALMPENRIVEVHLRRVGAGSIEAQILDRDGEPLQGWVVIESYDAPLAAGRTDKQGCVRFSNVVSGTYTIRAYADAVVAADVDLGAPDERFKGQDEIPAQTLVLEAGQHARVDLRPEPVGYVRGTLRHPDATSGQDYYLQQAFTSPYLTRIAYDPETSEYMVGPLPTGPHALSLSKWSVDAVAALHVVGRLTIRAEAGRLTRMDIAEPRPDDGDLETSTNAPRGTVLLDDGKTPAYGARLAMFPPGWSRVRELAWADANGTFAMRSPASLDPWALHGPDAEGDPAKPVIVASLPGRRGAAVVAYDANSADALKIVLPPPIHVRGRVTIGGKSLSGTPANVRIMAECQGRGVLDDILSVETTANQDGTYVLHGLTPGTYRIQATLDGIWLSKTVTIEIDKTRKDALDIDIPALGDVAAYRLVDKDGAPLVDASVTIDLPEGPYTTALRPATLPTDGAGILRLEGLPAGKNTIRLVDDGATFEITVPPLGKPDDEPRDLVVR